MTATRTEAAEHARAAYAARTQARIAEYAADWAGRPGYLAARHFGVTPRTIGRWRALLGLPDARARGGRDA